MTFKGRSRADHPARLTSQLNRERGNRRKLSLVTPAATGAVRQAVGEPVRSVAPARALPVGSGRLVSRWTTNASGRLVMVWSLEPVVEAAPAIRLSRRRLNAVADLGLARDQWAATRDAGGGSS
jgi:hypothetical protein